MFRHIQKKNFLETLILMSEKMRREYEIGKNPWIVAIIVGVIIFIFSLIVDFITRNNLDYGYAILLALIFGAVFFALQSLFNYTKRKRRLS